MKIYNRYQYSYHHKTNYKEISKTEITKEIKKDSTKSVGLYNLMKADNEDLVIDFDRTKNYL